MREVSIRVSLRRDALVHLHYIHLAPWNILLRKSAQHLPWRAAAAKRHCEPAAFLHRRARRRSDHLSPFLRDRIGIEKYFNLQESSSRNETHSQFKLFKPFKPPSCILPASQ